VGNLSVKLRLLGKSSGLHKKHLPDDDSMELPDDETLGYPASEVGASSVAHFHYVFFVAQID